MGNWRQNKRENFQQEWQPKPPSGVFFLLVARRSGQPTFPSWEKRLCTSVCKIPWRKICENKIYEVFYKNILEWNDSAGKEAFQNEKSMYWAEINGLPCDIPLLDPDRYIDVVDLSSSIDPKLLSALDGKRTVSEDDADDRKRQI
ncbi:hypothetical protein MRB53_027004 [Persea americana]|uniref:Uncharacterized protein n=1 Tax=Persea americana TaxID=3435 RepID=A0ACC2LJX2_PERAE|nr:hypothetical protein MRB53_027004 [Persea americana]